MGHEQHRGGTPARRPGPVGPPRVGSRHAESAHSHVASGDYAGEHWLATFAVYLLSSPICGMMEEDGDPHDQTGRAQLRELPAGPWSCRGCDVWDAIWPPFPATPPRFSLLLERDPNLFRAEYWYTQPIHFAVREGTRGRAGSCSDAALTGAVGSAKTWSPSPVIGAMSLSRPAARRRAPVAVRHASRDRHPIDRRRQPAMLRVWRAPRRRAAACALRRPCRRPAVAPGCCTKASASARWSRSCWIGALTSMPCMAPALALTPATPPRTSSRLIWSRGCWTGPFWRIRGRLDRSPARRRATYDSVIRPLSAILRSVRRFLSDDPGRIVEARRCGQTATIVRRRIRPRSGRSPAAGAGADPNWPEGATVPRGVALHAAARARR